VNTLKAQNGPYFAIPSSRIVELLNTAVERKTQGEISSRENDSREKAVQIPLEDPHISTSIHSPNDAGWYRFSLVSSGDLELSLQCTEKFRIEVFDNNETILGSSSGNNPFLKVYAPQGDVYLKVSGDDLVYWTTYTISANFKTFPDNYNHSSASSPVTAESGVWYSRILHRNDEDWFSVKTHPERALILETYDLIDSRFEIFNSSGTLLAEYYNEETAVESPRRPVYFSDKAVTQLLVRITGHNKPMGTYRFRVLQVSLAAENNTMMKTAVELTHSAPMLGSIKRIFERSWFSISRSHGTRLNVTVEGGDFSLEIYDSENNLLSKDDFNNHLSIDMTEDKVFLCVKAVNFKTGRDNNFVIFAEIN